MYTRTENYLFDVDLTAWGWVHMLIGAAAVLIGVCLLLGQYWALIAGICVAVRLGARELRVPAVLPAGGRC